MASECFLKNGPHKQALLIGPSYDLLPAELHMNGTANDLKIIKTILARQSFQLNSIQVSDKFVKWIDVWHLLE